MAIGKEVGAFTSSATAMTKSTDNAGNHTFVVNVEGSVSGGWSGAVVGTITATTGDSETGTYRADFAAYLEDGSVVTGTGSGVIGTAGAHKWQLNGTALLSDGSRAATEGVMELATRSYNGKMFAIT